MIYLDNAATTKPDPAVVDEMVRCLVEDWGNPGSVHEIGTSARETVESAREKVASFLGCDANEIIFTSGSTEGNAIVLGGMDYVRLGTHKDLVMTDSAEHDSIINFMDRSELGQSMDGLIEPLVDGVVSMECIDGDLSLYSERLFLVSIMHMNNETGAINDVYAISKLCNESGIPFHTDITQSAGYLDINAHEMGCDFMTMSGHKINGPKGIGALYIKDEWKEKLTPSIVGGDEQEFGLRGGTENVPGIAGLGVACELAKRNLIENHKRVDAAYDAFIEEFKAELIKHEFHSQIVIHCPNTSGKKIASIYIPGIDAETLVLFASRMGVAISAGSACTSRDIKASHVLLGMGIPEEEARQTIRVSFSHTNTVEEVKQAAGILARCVGILKEYIK